MKPSLFLFAFMLPITTMACLNKEAHTLKDGYEIYQDQEGDIIPLGHIFMIEDAYGTTNIDYHVASRLKRLDSLWRLTQDVAYRSDYGLVLIVGGRYEEAIKVYQEIERTNPGRYSTASNIGTAYELIGNNQEALKWIKRAIEINPAAHYNSEWLHAKILEAKIKGKDFYTADFLLGTNFGSGVEPVSNLSQEQLLDLRDALFYQLNERKSFIKPEDRMVAMLLFELGNVAFITDAKYEAYEIYEMAKDYGMSGELFELRYKHVLSNLSGYRPADYSANRIANPEETEQVKQEPLKESKTNMLWYFVSVACIAGVVAGVVKRIRRKNSRASS